MKKKKLLVLTAGYWQQPVIQCAKELGLYVLATDALRDAPAAKCADEFFCIDANDVHGLISLARKHDIAGVIAEQSDSAVLSGAMVASECGLPGIGVDVARRATNKKLMRDSCAEAGVPVPRYRCVENETQAISAAQEIGLPVVIKPTDSQSSKGVTKIWKLKDVSGAFFHAYKASIEGKVLIEEMLIGTESSVESYITENKIIILGISEKTKSSPPHSFDIKLIYPASFPDQLIAELKRVNEMVINAINLPSGLAHAEYILTSDGVFLIEIAARGCGAGVASMLVPAMTGFNPIRERIKLALGETQRQINFDRSRCGLLEFMIFPSGKVEKLTGLRDAQNIPGVVALDCFIGPGEENGIVTNASQRPAYCLAVADSYAELERIMVEVKSTFIMNFA